MAFCTSCGATLDPASSFCTACGTKTAEAVAPVSTGSGTAAAPAPIAAGPAPQQGSNVLKIVLIVIAVLVGLGLIGAGIVGYTAYRFAKSVQIEQSGDEVKIESPMGSFETSKDKDALVASLDVPLYAGAEVLDGGGALQIGKVKTATAIFHSDDSPEQVAQFYKDQLTGASYVDDGSGTFTIMENNERQMLTVVVQSDDDGSGTKFTITRASK